MIRSANLEPRTYPYYDKKTCGLDTEGMLKNLSLLPSGSIVLMHASAHNPTGVDPSEQEWRELAKVRIFAIFSRARAVSTQFEWVGKFSSFEK